MLFGLEGGKKEGDKILRLARDQLLVRSQQRNNSSDQDKAKISLSLSLWKPQSQLMNSDLMNFSYVIVVVVVCCFA